MNAQYNLAKPDSISIRIAGYQRRRMYECFLTTTGISEDHSILELGVTSDQTYTHSNYMVHWYPHKHRITACGIDDAAFLERMYPSLRCVWGDGRNLPFKDQEFDFVHSSAVLEHVGSREMQAQFLREAMRVARKGVFVTTPNRWFPIEFHTLLPIAHWLPPSLFRRICKKMGWAFFADKNNLNLLSASDLRKLALVAGMNEFEVRYVSLAGWPSNLILSARTECNPSTANSGILLSNVPTKI